MNTITQLLRAIAHLKPKQQRMLASILATSTIIIVGLVSRVPNTSTPPQASQDSSTATQTPTIYVTLSPTSLSSVEPTAMSSDLFEVIDVVDGDTIAVIQNGVKEKLRLVGIDTPEIVDPRKPVQCYAKEASDKAKSLLMGKKVQLTNDPTQGERDKYKRLLRYVFLEDGTNYNLLMIEEGYAFEYTYSKPYQYQEKFKKAQKEAQEQGKGLWGMATCSGKR